MTETWYKQRLARGLGLTRHDVTIHLSRAKWEMLDTECARLECSRSVVVSQIIDTVLEHAPSSDHLRQQTRDALVLLSDQKARNRE